MRESVKEVKSEMGKRKTFSFAFLSFLMLSTPLANAYLLGSFMQQPKTFTQNFTKTVEIEGRKFDFQGYGELTEYADGSKLVKLSVTLENLPKPVQKIRINLTKTVTAEELSLWKGETKKQSQTLTVQEKSITSTTTNPYDTVQFITEHWDSLVFVVYSPQIWIKYKHDDNYINYHPGNFDEPWVFEPYEFYNGTQYNNIMFHRHLSVTEVYDWWRGAKSAADIMQGYSAVAGSFIGAFLGGAVVSALSLTGWVGVLVSAILAAFGALIGWLLQLLGVSEAQFVENVVKAEQGDGWNWLGFGRTIYFDALPINVPGMGWLSYVNEWNAPYYAQLLSRYHRIDFLCYETKELQIRWGSDRDNPATGTGEAWYEMVVPAGIFADYGSLSK